MKPPFGLFILLSVCLSAYGCRQQGGSTEGLSVAVSIVPQAWLVEQIGGGRVEVVTLVKPGESPEVFQPSDAQVSQVMSAKAYFRIGLPFEEGKAMRAVAASGRVKVVDTRVGIQLRGGVPHEHGHAEHGHEGHEASDVQDASDAHAGVDPHVWSSPRLLAIQARTVAQTLSELDPAGSSEYQANLKALEEAIARTDQQIRQILATLKGKAFFVFHPAWGYFADDYGLRQVAIEIEGKEPSDRELTQLQQSARDEGIRVIFVQPQISAQSAAAVAKAVGARLETLDPLAEDVLANLLEVARKISASRSEVGESIR